MKRNIILILSVFILIFFGYAKNNVECKTQKTLSEISYKDFDCFRRVSFYSSGKVEFSDEENWSSNKLWNRIYDYNVVNDGNISYLTINKNDFSEKLLMLYSEDFLVLYSSNNELIFKGASKINSECIFFPSVISSTSELKEGSILYASSNLRNLELNKCWVENKSDYGIGECLTFGINGRGLILFNGYLSGSKTYLYEQNSRVKTIEIKLLKDKVSKIYEIKDTPNPQLILFDAEYSGDVELKIIDVYKGSKYSDTCINSILLVH